MSIGLFIGRFQPLHLGHLSAIKQALKQVDFLIIGIGSAQYNHQPKNPFSLEERESMIKKALKEHKIPKKHFKIIAIPDIHDNPKWPAHVRSLTPPFDVLFMCNDSLVKELFEKYDDIPIKKVKKEVNICATDIRKTMINGENWKKHISKSTIEYLEEIGGAGRIKSEP